MEVLNTLVDWKKISSVSQTTVRSWGYGLTGLSERQIRAGLELSKDHVGYFDLGVFRQYCFQRQPSYQPSPTTARLSDPKTLGNSRFQELMKFTKAMDESPVGSPLHKASLDGFLTPSFIRGKSAEQLIDICNKRYGAAA